MYYVSKQAASLAFRTPWLFTFGFVSLFLGVLHYPLILHPVAAFEDGKYVLEYFHLNADIGSVWRFYASYVSLFPNLIGYATSKLPLVWQPTLLTIIPLFIAAAAFSVLASRSLQIPGLSQAQKLVLVLVLCSAPISNAGLLTITMFSFWNLLVLQIFIVLFWRFENNISSALAFLCCGLSILSSPVALIVTPLLLWRALRSKTMYQSLVFGTLLAICALYLAVGIDFSAFGGSSPSASLSLNDLFRGVLERGIFEAVFGTWVRMHLIWNDLHAVMWVISAALILGLIVLARALKTEIAPLAEPIIQLGYIFAAALFLSWVTRGFELDLAYGHRYSYLSKIAFLSISAILLMKYLELKVARRHLSRSLPLGVLAVWVVTSITTQQAYARAQQDEAARLGTFLTHVMARNKTGDGFCLVLERPMWDIELASNEPQNCETYAP